MRNYQYRSKHGWWGSALLVVIILLLVGSCTYFRSIKTGTVTLTVSSKDDQAQGSSGHKYLIFTTKGVYQDTDNLWHGKFDSSDFYASIRVGKTYRCTYTGFRVPFFSSYRNLISCHVVR